MLKTKLLVSFLLLVALLSASSCGNTPQIDSQSQPGPTTASATVSVVTQAQQSLIAPTSTAMGNSGAQSASTPDPQPTNIATATSQPTNTLVSDTPASAPTLIPASTSTMSPASTATATVTQPGIPSANADPDLEAGFPIQLPDTASRPDLLVANINDDPQLELLVQPGTQLANVQDRFLFAFRSNGSPVPGWPVHSASTAHVALGEFSTLSPGLETLTQFVTKTGVNGQVSEYALAAYSGSGTPLPGGPSILNHLNPPPFTISADLNGDGIDEILYGSQAFAADASSLPGWPIHGGAAEAVADLDGDGLPDIVTSPGNHQIVGAYHGDGTAISGFDPAPQDGYIPSQEYDPIVGDVDGDGKPEIITASWYKPSSATPGAQAERYIQILSASGQIEQTIRCETAPNETLPGFLRLALADLDCDGVPEIIGQTNHYLFAWKGDGTLFPGWPQQVHPNNFLTPAIGDVDGDGQPDIVTSGQLLIDGQPGVSGLLAFDRHGKLLPHFPKALDALSSAVAVADVDADGRNEIAVATEKNVSGAGGNDELWLFDLHGEGKYGAVQWGQEGGGPRRQNAYPPGTSCSP
jgi:FG-GAP-like repeat